MSHELIIYMVLENNVPGLRPSGGISGWTSATCKKERDILGDQNIKMHQFDWLDSPHALHQVESLIKRYCFIC